MTLSRTPVYNLGAVLKETDLAADTLRAWERRYGIPMPKRTPGGHRLYSEWDIALIKWLKRRQAEGMTISRAVDRWKNLTADGSDPLAAEQPASASNAGQSSNYNRLDAIRDQWLAACLKYDEAGAEQILNQAYAEYSVETVTASVVMRALHDVGEMWTRREVSVQQEHFLSALTARRLDSLIAASPAPMEHPVIVLACAEGDPHSLPMLYLNMLLRRRGRKVVFLGADVPVDRIGEAAQAANATLVVLSAEQIVGAAALKDAAAVLTKKHLLVAFGGRIFSQQPELQSRVAGTYLGDDLHTAVERIEQLLEKPVPPARRIPPGGGPEAGAFRQALPRIELNVKQYFSKTALPSRLLLQANNQFGPGLAAALELGDVKYLESDVNWIRNFLIGQGLPVKSLHDYLMVYADAVRKVMGSSATDLTGWIRSVAARV